MVMSDTARLVAEREAIDIAEEAKDHAEPAVGQQQIDLKAAGHLTSFSVLSRNQTARRPSAWRGV